jgi:hypothetical protein
VHHCQLPVGRELYVKFNGWNPFIGDFLKSSDGILVEAGV